jgi:phytanoyl-CoA hydroxylase
MAQEVTYRPAPSEGLTALTPEQKRFFDENGYLVVRNLYSAEEVERLREMMNAILRDPDSAPPGVGLNFEEGELPPGATLDPNNPKRIWMLFDTPNGGDAWLDQAREPRIVDIISDLLGPNINFHNGKARIKPPGYQSHQIWHQDWPYERHSSPDLAAAIIYLDDTGPNAAATEVVPGSHLRGEWPCGEDYSIPDEAVTTPGVPIYAQAGDVAFIHVLVVHRAGNNDSDQNRSCIINEYKTAEALDQWGNGCAYAEMPLRRDRQPV